MTAFVALLRGVNVGKAKRIAMADWRVQLETLGYTGVRTLLNSGNAVFSSATGSSSDHATAIQTSLKERLQLEVPVVVKSAAAIAALVKHNPLDQVCTDASRLLVVLAQDDAALQSLEGLRPLLHRGEQLEVRAHAGWLWCAEGILQSNAGAALLGKIKGAMTSRNWATLQKIAGLLEGL